MAGKNAFLRYRIIDECLRNKSRRYGLKDLVFAICQRMMVPYLSESTFNKDIRFMREELLAPIGINRTHGFYFYHSDFSLSGTPITIDEERALSISVSALEQIRLTKYGSLYTALVGRISRSTRVFENQIVDFEKGESSAVIKWFDFLYDSILEKRTLNVQFRNPANSLENRILSPCLLKEYKGQFYLIGLLHQSMDVSKTASIGLETIVEISFSEESYQLFSHLDVSDYFNNQLGCTIQK